MLGETFASQILLATFPFTIGDMQLETLCHIKAPFLHGFHLLLQRLGYRTQLLDLLAMPFLCFNDRSKLALDGVQRRHNRTTGLLGSLFPALRAGVLHCIRLGCCFHTLWRGWHIEPTPRGPGVRAVRDTARLAGGAHANRHKALAVPWACKATGEPQRLDDHRGWG